MGFEPIRLSSRHLGESQGASPFAYPFMATRAGADPATCCSTDSRSAAELTGRTKNSDTKKTLGRRRHQGLCSWLEGNASWPSSKTIGRLSHSIALIIRERDIKRRGRKRIRRHKRDRLCTQRPPLAFSERWLMTKMSFERFHKARDYTLRKLFVNAASKKICTPPFTLSSVNFFAPSCRARPSRSARDR